MCFLFWLKASNCQYAAVFDFHLVLALAFCFYFSFGTVSHLHTHNRTHANANVSLSVSYSQICENDCEFTDTESDARISQQYGRHGMVLARYGASSVRLATK